MAAVAVAGNSTVLVGSNVKVGEEGSTTARPTIVNTGTGTTSTTQTGVSLTADLWSVGNVFLATGTSVTGSVTTAGTLTRQSGVTVGGPISQNASLTPVSTTLSVVFPASSTNITIGPDATGSISPGAFANVTVNSRSTLTLSSGTYFMDALDVEPQGVIVLTGAGPFIINVRTSFAAKGQITVSAVSPPPTFVVVDAGTADVFLQAQFDGTLIAPNANITLAAIGTASYHGAFFGKSVTLQAGVNVLHRSVNAGTVAPVAECVITQPDGTYKAVFGYNASTLLGNVTIAVGANNTFVQAPASRGQPTVFVPGRQRAQFMVPFNGRALTWTLDGTSTTASVALSECTAACVRHLVDPTQPRINTPLTTAAPLLSEDESRVLRDTFRWQDTLPVPESFSDGTPRLYYGIVYITSADTLQTMDFLRIHYSNTPLFETELTAFEQAGIVGKFSYPADGPGQFVYALIPGAVFNALRRAALDPAEPTEILQALPFRPIPTSDLGVTAQSSCGLQPITQCVAQAANGTLRAVFSYTNPAGNPVTIPVGTDNNLTGGPAGSRPPEAFNAGQHTAVFAVSIPTGATVRWNLNGQVASASTATVRCSAAVVAQIGVDTFNPFPAPATPSCRFATPGEARWPLSSLPPAARANTCVSMSYNYLGTLGFKWRNVDADADDAPGLAADAAFALGGTTAAAPSGTLTSTFTTSGGTQAIRSALFGKLFRKAIQVVGSIGKAVVDAGRRGLRAVAGVFLGSTDIEVTIDPQYTDTGFVPGTMKQAWGANFGKAISLAGLEIRANRSVFLSVANLDATNHARVKVLNHLSGARLCFRMTSGAGFVTDGFLPDEICLGQTVNRSMPAPTLAVRNEEVNMMAQMTDARAFMTGAAQFTNDRAEVVVGRAANLIGRIQGISDSANRNRAFTPCLSFSWKNEVEIYLELIVAAATTATFDYVDKNVQAGAGAVLRPIARGLQGLVTQQAALAVLATQYAGTALGNQIATAKAVVDDAVAKLTAARNAATVLTQEANDFATAAQTAARFVTGNNPAAGTAQKLVQQTLDNVNAQSAATTVAVQTAAQAVNNAAAAMATLAVQAATTAAATAINDVRDEVNVIVGEVTNVAIVAIGKAAATVAAAIVEGVVQIIGSVIAEVFEFAAGGDVLMPAAAGDHTNLTDRAVMTHEYGHFTLCNLLEKASPATFALAYDDAAVQGIVSGQSVSAAGAILNESFADLITSQVAGGTNYATPAGGGIKVGSEFYCFESNSDCIEHNTTNNDIMSSFNTAVLRDVSLFTDAFDGLMGRPLTFDRPMSGNEWAVTMPGLTLAPNPGQDAHDDVVNLRGNGFRRWIAHAMGGFNLIREDNFFRGLSDAMVEDSFNWCARCQVFALHTLDAAGHLTCPTTWVGPRPTYNANGTTGTLTCTFEGPCPAMTIANPNTSVCDPNCPPGTFFDPVRLDCEPNIIIP